MQGHHAVLIQDQEEARMVLKEIGVDPGAYKYMVPKAVYRCIKLKRVNAIAANILKQEMLSKGGEAAVKREALLLEGDTDVLLMGSLKQYRLLLDKLRDQPFGLDKIAIEIQDLLDTLENGKSRVKLANGRTLDIGCRTLIMGILNLTPDSFYDGNRYSSPDMAVKRAFEMVEEGADIIDIGGASSRPGSVMIEENREIERILPIIKRLENKGIVISVDTFRTEVARVCLDNGVNLINDIGRLKLNTGLLPVLVKNQSPVILMHNRLQFDQGKPYKDLISDIILELKESIKTASDAGLDEDKIIVDPGLGFGKNASENRLIVKRLWEFKSLGKPLLAGASRKSFIGQTLGIEVDKRLEGSLAVAAMAIVNGADIIRVHDVKETKKVALMTDAVMRENG
jgi:dihydropteroate synthase